MALDSMVSSWLHVLLFLLEHHPEILVQEEAVEATVWMREWGKLRGWRRCLVDGLWTLCLFTVSV